MTLKRYLIFCLILSISMAAYPDEHTDTYIYDYANTQRLLINHGEKYVGTIGPYYTSSEHLGVCIFRVLLAYADQYRPPDFTVVAYRLFYSKNLGDLVRDTFMRTANKRL